MRVCRVIGTLVASAHHPTYDGKTILVCQPEKPDGTSAGSAVVALDRVQAGIGDRVLVMTEGNGVRQLLGKDAGPIEALVVGVVDDVDVPGFARGAAP